MLITLRQTAVDDEPDPRIGKPILEIVSDGTLVHLAIFEYDGAGDRQADLATDCVVIKSELLQAIRMLSRAGDPKGN